MKPPAGLVPAAPLLAIVEREAASRECSMRDLAMVVEGGGRPGGLEARVRLWRLGQRWTTFELADKIVTRLLGADAWHVLPELATIYETDD